MSPDVGKSSILPYVKYLSNTFNQNLVIKRCRTHKSRLWNRQPAWMGRSRNGVTNKEFRFGPC